MRVSWKTAGLAGLAGVAATGVIVARKRRVQHDYDSDELRQRLHERLAEVANGEPPGVPPPGVGSNASRDAGTGPVS